MTDLVLFDCKELGKRCIYCGETKPPSEYYINKRSGTRINRCRSCIYKKTSAYHRNNPDKAREFKRRYRTKNADQYKKTNDNYRIKNPDRLKGYAKRQARKRKLASLGMTVDGLEEAFRSQNGLCAICEKKITLDHGHRGQTAHIDHCHKTNRFRGILCSYCNVGLGHFFDDPTRLGRAISYLKVHCT